MAKANDQFDGMMDLGGAEDLNAAADNLVLDLNSVDESKANFEAIPAGTYDCVVENTEYGISKNGGNPMLSVTFKVTDPAYEKRLLFNHYVLNQDIGVANLKKFLLRVCPDVELGNFSPQQFADNGVALGLPCRCKITIKPYQGEKRNQVKEVLAPTEGVGGFLD